MTVRKGLSLLICALLLVSVFAGCGSGAAQNTTAAATQAQTQGTTAQATTAQATQAKAPVSIGFFHWKGEEKDTWDKIINMFQEKNPGITVNMEILPEDQYYTKLQAEVMAGESQGLDVFEVNPGSRFKTFLRADAYMDLTGQPFLNDLSPIYLSCGQDNGKQYIIPLSKSFVGIFYNKTILAKTGMDVPKTWDDFLKVCEAIKKSGVQVIATGMADAWTSTLPFLEILVQQSDDLQIYPKLAKGEMKFTDPLFKNVLTPLNELAKKGYIMKNASGTKYEQSLTLFATGKAAMLNQGTWAIGAIRKLNPDLDFSIMLLPSPGGKLVAGVQPAQSPCIYSKSAHKDEALKFMSFIFSKEAMEIYGNGTGQEVPNVNAVLTDKDLAAMAPVGNSGQIYPHNFSEWSQIDQDIESEMTARAMMGEDVDTILKDAQSKLASLNLKVN